MISNDDKVLCKFSQQIECKLSTSEIKIHTERLRFTVLVQRETAPSVARDAPPRIHPIFFLPVQFSRKFWQNIRLAPLTTRFSPLSWKRVCLKKSPKFITKFNQHFTSKLLQVHHVFCWCLGLTIFYKNSITWMPVRCIATIHQSVTRNQNW